jgi:hypothetical protein
VIYIKAVRNAVATHITSQGAQQVMASTKKFGSNRHNISRKVVRMRTKDLMSWMSIAAELGISPKLARKLFQERTGEHQHHDHLQGKGGRFPRDWDTTAEVPYLPGKGQINDWFKLEAVDDSLVMSSNLG